MINKIGSRNAGLGLALLYLTVLNFDNITFGYCVYQVSLHICMFVEFTMLYLEFCNTPNCLLVCFGTKVFSSSLKDTQFQYNPRDVHFCKFTSQKIGLRFIKAT
jgi:hypothetical protein